MNQEYCTSCNPGRHTAQATLQKLCTKELADVGYYHFIEDSKGIDNCIVARTGYTGEDGFEVFFQKKAFEAVPKISGGWSKSLGYKHWV